MKCYSWCIRILSITTIILFLSPYILSICGKTPYTVTSGSMLPTYKVGSIVFVYKVDENNISVGDVITFKYAKNMIVTHRVVEVDKDGVITKGDANNTTEGVIPFKDIIGKTSDFCVPYVGYIYDFIQNYKLFIIGFLLILFLVDWILNERKGNIEKKE